MWIWSLTQNLIVFSSFHVKEPLQSFFLACMLWDHYQGNWHYENTSINPRLTTWWVGKWHGQCTLSGQMNDLWPGQTMRDSTTLLIMTCRISSWTLYFWNSPPCIFGWLWVTKHMSERIILVSFAFVPYANVPSCKLRPPTQENENSIPYGKISPISFCPPPL